MTTLLLATIAFAVVSSVITVLAVRHAPEGYEDETGFHTVRPSRRPAPATARDLKSPSLHSDHLAGGLA